MEKNNIVQQHNESEIEEQEERHSSWCNTVFDTLFYHALGNRGLSLAQGESMELFAHARGISQLQQGSCGVHPRRQNKDQRSTAARFFHYLQTRQRQWS